jgi:hypothetical protein
VLQLTLPTPALAFATGAPLIKMNTTIDCDHVDTSESET